MSRHISKGGVSTADKIANREAACEKILAQLAKKPMTVAEIMAALNLKDGTVCRYLNYLAEMGEACRQAERGPNNRQIWQLGREGVAKDERKPTNAFSGATVVPARQIGMWRDPWDVLLFGPANTQ